MSDRTVPASGESAGLIDGLVRHNDSRTGRVYETAKYLYSGAVKDLLSLGVCERCIFRLVAVEAFDSDISSVSTSSLRTWLGSVDDETVSSESCCSRVCIVCFGILQFVFSDAKQNLVKTDSCSDYVARITDMVKQGRHEFDSFGLEVSVPSTITENERAVLSYLKGKYSTEGWLQSENISVKDALKVLVLDPLKESLGAKSDSSSFHIRLTYSNAADEAQKTDAKYGSNCTFENPFGKVYEPCILSVHCNMMPIFFSGRYFKYSRNVSQSRWIIDDERMGEESVEEILGGNILLACCGDSYKFHSAGREDIDVRMLGSGRPFLIEIQNSRHCPSEQSLKEVEEKINNSEKKLVGVTDLKCIGSQCCAMMREGEAEKQKQYAAPAWISRPLEEKDLNSISSLKELPYEELPDREPDQKKLKLSNTDQETDSSAAAAGGSNGAERKGPKYRRRKVAIVFAFCGVGYQGMQKNPGAKTIEGELEEALFHAGAVPAADRNRPRAYEWARAARTDKGVSAVGQVVSGRFYVDPPGFVDRLNSNLPDQIRVFGFKRVAPSFSSKKFCDRRRYVYLIPVFALDPCLHSDCEMVRTDSGYEYVKCVECSDKGYKIPVSVMGKDKGYTKSLELQSDILSSNIDGLETDVKYETLSSSLPSGEKNFSSEILNAGITTKENPDSSSKAEDMEESDALAKGEMNDGERRDMTKSDSKFSYGEKEKERFNRILSYYVGSHNFHNFTTRTKATDPSANRYILSFSASTVINLDGEDFVKCEVVGQSFMLHQIRKMIGLAVAVMRNYAPESLIESAFKKDVRINVPMAPEVGLYLDECFFTSYNQRFKGSHEELSMEEYKEVAEEFKWKHVYSHIGSAEKKKGAVAIWLHSLNQRNYPDLRNEHKPDEVIVYKTISEASEEKIHEEKITAKENTNGGTAELFVVDKVNDETSEAKSTEETTSTTVEEKATE